MKLVRRGDRSALRELFDRHHRQVFGFVLGRLGDADPSEDVAQEVFIRVWRYRDSYDTDRRFLPWLYRITRNLLSDSKSGPVLDSPGNDAPSSHLPPDEQFEERQRAEKVRSAVLGLPPAQREVLLLSRWSGMTYREIGDIVGCSEGAVKVRVHRALEALRSPLAPLRED
ncbi:MAG: RNA polymerase sigma factor [Gemmatimonadetes bacterium]|nr:RNA polymerase sigma factor [Gemmatimonadota bacterium]NNM04598.1 RNA polymerase sigma factor [Gemmatimonadota bacterium]